jgi:hypothetical protein
MDDSWSSELTVDMIKSCVENGFGSWEGSCTIELDDVDEEYGKEYYVAYVHPAQQHWIQYMWDYSKPKRRKAFAKAFKWSYGYRF